MSTLPRILPVLILLSLAHAAPAAPVLPDFAAADFSQATENPYFPLRTGLTRTLMGTGIEDGEPIVELGVLTVIGPGPVIMGAPSVTVIDEAYSGGRLVERTYDYFAADAAGNVWYLGEDVENFRYDAAGGLIGTDTASAWRAGVNGAMPGISMPATLTPGTSLFQEHAPVEEAMDYAELVETGLVIETPEGVFTDAIKFFEGSTADPDLREFKYYAPDVGMIRADEHLDETRANPAVVVESQR